MQAYSKNEVIGNDVSAISEKLFSEPPMVEKLKANQVNYIDLTANFSVPGQYSWHELMTYLSRVTGPDVHKNEVLKICDTLKDLGYEHRDNTDEENEDWRGPLKERQLDFYYYET